VSALMLCAVALAPAGAAAAPTGSIAGTVTEAAGGAPVEAVEVCAWDVVDEINAGCTFTDAGGSYVLTELPAGEYKIEFWPPEGPLLPQLYDHQYSFREADLVSVKDGEAVAGIDAALEVGGEISGTVYSGATGAPLEGIEVCVVKATSGRLSICMETDDDGRYLFAQLPPRDYKIAFSLDFSEFFEEELEEEDDGFQTQFWDDQTTLAAANVIALGSGQAIADIDGHLEATPSVVLAAPSPGGTTATPDLPPVEGAPSLLTAQPPAGANVPASPKHCRKGFPRRKIKGKVRCVKRRKHRHHHRRGKR
jgi:Carboxypeptidase regulatory-like domain